MDAQWPRFLSTLATRARPSIQEGAKALTSALLSQIHSGLRVCTSLDWVCTGVGYELEEDMAFIESLLCAMC